MISNKWQKLIKSLHLKKFRQEHQAFIVEGKKSVEEAFLSGWKIIAVFGTDEFLNSHSTDLQNIEHYSATEDELKKVGTFENNNAALAVIHLPKSTIENLDWNANLLVLDHIQDPGNLGTIIRTADWYNITQIVCSSNTTDAFAPKVVNATMGAIFRTKLIYTDLNTFFSKNKNTTYGALLNGKNIHKEQINRPFTLVIGNESNGISDDNLNHIKEAITIPRFGKSESLNAAIATGILLDNFMREK